MISVKLNIMAVYVDNFYVTGGGNFGRMKMSHMMADTTEELLEMADKIGLKRIWLQYPGESTEHFDVSITKRKEAIQSGAIEVNMRPLASWSVGGRVKPLNDYITEHQNRIKV